MNKKVTKTDTLIKLTCKDKMTWCLDLSKIYQNSLISSDSQEMLYFLSKASSISSVMIYNNIGYNCFRKKSNLYIWIKSFRQTLKNIMLRNNRTSWFRADLNIIDVSTFDGEFDDC